MQRGKVTEVGFVIFAVTLLGMRFTRPRSVSANPVIPSDGHTGDCHLQAWMLDHQLSDLDKVRLMRCHSDSLLIEDCPSHFGVLDQFINFEGHGTMLS